MDNCAHSIATSLKVLPKWFFKGLNSVSKSNFIKDYFRINLAQWG